MEEFRKWQNLLNEHIFDKPVAEVAKSKNVMWEVDELIADLSPSRGNLTWNSTPATQCAKHEEVDNMEHVLAINNTENKYLESINRNLESKIDDNSVSIKDWCKTSVVSNGFLKDLSPHWLVEIIKAQQRELSVKSVSDKNPNEEMVMNSDKDKCEISEDVERKAEVEECNKSLVQEEKTARNRLKLKSFPVRKPKKTNSEPSHRFCKKSVSDKNRLASIQSMDDVRQTDGPKTKQRSSRTIEKKRVNRHVILENTIRENQCLNAPLSAASCEAKTDETSTEVGSDVESEKTGTTKVLHWLNSLPKDHKGIRNAKKFGKCSLNERPRWNI